MDQHIRCATGDRVFLVVPAVLYLVAHKFKTGPGYVQLSLGAKPKVIGSFPNQRVVGIDVPTGLEEGGE
jgi:hypothetical protein